MDKFKSWKEIKFDVIFHGDDWKGSTMYNGIEKKFNEVGVDMVFFPYTKGTSSTILTEILGQALKKKKASNE